MRVARLLAAGLLLIAALACANDSNATLGAGGLVPKKSSVIVMESEDLRISVHEVSVRYVFRNAGARDLDEIVAFPLPEIEGGLLANDPVDIPSSDPLNYIAFKISADGVAISPGVEVRAFFDGAEITSQLRALHLPLSVLDPGVTAAVNKLAPADRGRIVKSEWVDCSLTPDHKCWPYWKSRIQYYWTQHFPTRRTVEITHTYHPVVGGGTMYRGEEVKYYADYFRRYCPSPDAIDHVKRGVQLRPGEKPDGSHAAFSEKEIEYILTTAKSWSGSIRNYHLTVISDSPDDIVASCLPGLRRIAPTRYEMQQSNFRPDNEVELLILRPVK